MLLKTLFIFAVLLGLSFSLPEPLFAQCATLDAKITEWKEKRQERVLRRNYEKERDRLIQEHINRQTPEVQERMKQNRKESQGVKKSKREPFYKRFTRKSKRDPFYKRWFR